MHQSDQAGSLKQVEVPFHAACNYPGDLVPQGYLEMSWLLRGRMLGWLLLGAGSPCCIHARGGADGLGHVPVHISVRKSFLNATEARDCV